ncbi:hypothetical protein FQA39_LY11021 [Lamprigera yunnana]|nr:hypothetical protein FQA39_LY11021 [Lamprigera yunnana]
MNNSKCIISKHTHLLVKDGSNNIINKPANRIVLVPLTKSISQMFNITDYHDQLLQEIDEDTMLSNIEYLTESSGSEEPKDAVQNQKNETLVELLIAEYSKRPALYNEKLPLIQRSRSIKKALELEVYSALQGEMSIEDIRKKWNSLKKEYRKQHAQLWKYLRGGISLEEAAAIISKPLWKNYLAPTFINDPTDFRETESNVARVNEKCSSGISSASPSNYHDQLLQEIDADTMLSNIEYLTESSGSEEPKDAVQNQKNETLVELLIAEYSKRPALYNEKLPLIQRSRSIKKALELEVYSALQGEMSIEDIRKKWNSLKKEYRKQHAQLWKYLRGGISLEEAAAIISKPLWKNYLAPTFINDPTDFRETESNVARVNEKCSSGISSASPSSRY